MEQPLYRFLEMTAEANGILHLLQPVANQVVAWIALLALFTCFMGFYSYRVMNGVLALLVIAYFGRMYLPRIWDESETVTFIAVIGVTVAFLAYRWYYVAAVSLSAVVGTSWMLQLVSKTEWSAVSEIVLLVLAAVLCGLLAFLFPVWSIYGFSALWGAITFTQTAGYLLPFMAQIGTALSVVIAVVLFAAGGATQCFVFRKQRLFTHLMPKKLEYYFENKKREASNH